MVIGSAKIQKVIFNTSICNRTAIGCFVRPADANPA
jgi:hypothetical protein